MFGEKILYQPAGKMPSRLDPRFIPGIFFGVVEGSEEVLVGTGQGVVKARSFKRLPADGRADPAAFRAVIGVPWRLVPGDAGEVKMCPLTYQPLLGRMQGQWFLRSCFHRSWKGSRVEPPDKSTSAEM